MADSKAALTATVAVKENATTELPKVADALKAVGATEEEVSKKIAQSQVAVEMAQKSRLSTSEQLKFSMQAEAAKGNELATQLVTLERDYAILVRQMRVMADYGQQIPQSMIAQANAAKQAASAIREQQEAASNNEKTFEKFKLGGIAAASFALAASASKEAIKALAKELVESTKGFDELSDSATRADKTLASIKQTVSDPEFQKMNFLSKGMALAMSALSTEAADLDAKLAQLAKTEKAQALDRAASIDVIEEETKKLREQDANRARVAKTVQEFHEKEKKLAEESAKAKQKALEKETADFQREIRQWEDAEQAYYDRRKKAQGEQLASLAKAFKAESDYYSRKADLDEKLAKEQDKRDQEREDSEKALRNAALDTGKTVAAAWAEAGVAMAMNSKSGSDAAKQAAFTSARAAIMAASSEGAAKAIAAHSGIPFVGVAIGLAAAGAIVTAIMAYMTKFHSGGVIKPTDGVRMPGMAADERAVTVRVGENVQTAEQQRGGSGSVVINLHSRSVFAPTSAETKRSVRDVARVMKRVGGAR